MPAIEIINKLDEAGDLKTLVLSGLIPNSVLSHRDVYNFVDAQKKSGVRVTHAVVNAAYRFDIRERQVWRIIKAFG